MTYESGPVADFEFGPPGWFWRLLAVLAVFTTFAVITIGTITALTAVGRQRDLIDTTHLIRRNQELSLCLGALESRLHLGEIAVLETDSMEERAQIIDSLDLNELAIRLQHLGRYCP